MNKLMRMLGVGLISGAVALGFGGCNAKLEYSENIKNQRVEYYESFFNNHEIDVTKENGVQIRYICQLHEKLELLHMQVVRGETSKDYYNVGTVQSAIIVEGQEKVDDYFRMIDSSKSERAKVKRETVTKKINTIKVPPKFNRSLSINGEKIEYSEPPGWINPAHGTSNPAYVISVRKSDGAGMIYLCRYDKGALLLDRMSISDKEGIRTYKLTDMTWNFLEWQQQKVNDYIKEITSAELKSLDDFINN